MRQAQQRKGCNARIGKLPHDIAMHSNMHSTKKDAAWPCKASSAKGHACKLGIGCLPEPTDAELHQGDASCLDAALAGLQLALEGQIEKALLAGSIAIKQDGTDACCASNHLQPSASTCQ